MQASVWLNNGLPASICGPKPNKLTSESPWAYGFFRTLDDSECEKKKLNKPCYQFLSICDPNATKFVAMWGPEFQSYLDALLPEITTK